MFTSFFSFFDDVKGPVVVFEEPTTAAFQSGRVWEMFSDYVMTGNELLDRRVVQVRAGADAVLCLPVVLKDPKYSRNALLFSLGVAVPGSCLDAAATACRPALVRSARALRAMELETSALSRKDSSIAVMVPLALKRLRAAAGAAALSVLGPNDDFRVAAEAAAADDSASFDDDDDPNVFALGRPWHLGQVTKKPQQRKRADAVEHWEVPVLLARPRDLLDVGRHDRRRRWYAGGETWDLAVQQVMPHVDGIRNVKQVAKASHVDVDIVARSLRVLRHFGCLAVIDTFQYGNVYRATPRTNELASTPDALDACVAFVLRMSSVDLDAALATSFDTDGDSSVSSDDRQRRLKKKRFPDEDDDILDDIDEPSFRRRGKKKGGGGVRKIRRDNTDTTTTVRAADLVLRLYCSFANGKSVKDVLLGCDSRLLVDTLDHRAFAAYGAVHGLLKRVHRFPTAILRRDRRAVNPMRQTWPPEGSSSLPGGTSEDDAPDLCSSPPHQTTTTSKRQNTRLHDALDLMDGSHCMDAICSALEMPPARVDDLVRDAGYDIQDVYR